MVCVVYDVSEEATIEKVSKGTLSTLAFCHWRRAWSSTCSLHTPQADAQLTRVLGNLHPWLAPLGSFTEPPWPGPPKLPPSSRDPVSRRERGWPCV